MCVSIICMMVFRRSPHCGSALFASLRSSSPDEKGQRLIFHFVLGFTSKEGRLGKAVAASQEDEIRVSKKVRIGGEKHLRSYNGGESKPQRYRIIELR